MQIKFDEKGLVPVVVQEINTGKVLMLAYMNEQALAQTVETGKATYYSRSRRQLWVKGETSGNTQAVRGLYYDCDADSLLCLVEQTGVACHTGSYSCFTGEIVKSGGIGGDILTELYDVVLDRKANPREGSYTNYLFDKGVDKICKKIGEEASEVIIAAKNSSKSELICELSDLLYHMMVLMAECEVATADVFGELRSRR